MPVRALQELLLLPYSVELEQPDNEVKGSDNFSIKEATKEEEEEKQEPE